MGENKILVKSKSGMRMVYVNGGRGYFELDEPVWAPDDNYRACPDCKKSFDLLRRKHHCRRCGEVFCGSCAVDKVIPKRLQFIDPVRMCSKCQKISRWENDFFNNYYKKLKAGVELSVADQSDDSTVSRVSLSGDGGVLNITSEGGPIIPILMEEITSYRISQEGSDGVHMLSLDTMSGRTLVLTKTNAAESVTFLNGLRKALRMCAKPDHQKSGPGKNDPR